MKVLKFKTGTPQPKWCTKASNYARYELGLFGDAEDLWKLENLGFYSYMHDEGYNIVFEHDQDYTMCMLRWA